MHKCHQATPPKHDANACEMVKTKIRSYWEKSQAIMVARADIHNLLLTCRCEPLELNGPHPF